MNPVEERRAGGGSGNSRSAGFSGGGGIPGVGMLTVSKQVRSGISREHGWYTLLRLVMCSCRADSYI